MYTLYACIIITHHTFMHTLFALRSVFIFALAGLKSLGVILAATCAQPSFSWTANSVCRTWWGYIDIYRHMYVLADVDVYVFAMYRYVYITPERGEA